MLSRIACLVIGLGCSTAAWADAPIPATQATPLADPTLHYEIDTGHSSIFFKVKRNGVSNFFGRFNKFSGTISLLEKGRYASGDVKISIAVDSLDTSSGARDNKLKSDKDLFAAADFPEVTFASSRVGKVGKDRFVVQGDLTFRGLSQPLRFEARRLGATTDKKGGGSAGFESVIRFSRAKFGMTGMANSIGDEAEVTVSLACALKAPVAPVAEGG